jgi:hypothetical protein
MNKAIIYLIISSLIFGCNSNRSDDDKYIPFKINMTSINSLKDIKGLWRCVKVLNNVTKEQKNNIYEDIYLTDDNLYFIEYPHCGDIQPENINFQNKTLISFNKFYNSIDSFSIGKIGDTLILRETEKSYHSVTRYFLEIPFNLNIINQIITFGFNPESFEGDWQIFGALDEEEDICSVSGLKYKVHDNLNLQSGDNGNYNIVADTLYYRTDNQIFQYKIVTFYKSKMPESGDLLIIDLNHKEGPEYKLQYREINNKSR